MEFTRLSGGSGTSLSYIILKPLLVSSSAIQQPAYRNSAYLTCLPPSNQVVSTPQVGDLLIPIRAIISNQLFRFSAD